MATLVWVYSLWIDSAGYIEDEGFREDGPKLLGQLFTRDLRSTVLVEEVHHGVKGVEAEVSRVLVSREILTAFADPTHLDWQAKVGRRRYYDIANPEIMRHMWDSLDYPRRSQREEEVHQRNTNLFEWLWEGLLGKSFPGVGESTREDVVLLVDDDGYVLSPPVSGGGEA